MIGMKPRMEVGDGCQELEASNTSGILEVEVETKESKSSEKGGKAPGGLAPTREWLF